MAYTVIWMRGPTAVASKTFDDLPEATAYAEDNLPDIRTRFGANAVRIVDERGTPHYLKSVGR